MALFCHCKPRASKKPNCSHDTEYWPFTSPQPLPCHSLSFHVSLMNVLTSRRGETLRRCNLFAREGGEGSHILLLRCPKPLSQMETHKPTIRATISASISPSVAAPLPLCRHICSPARGRWANGFVVFSSKQRSVCFCPCLFVLRLSVLSIPTQPKKPLLSLASRSWLLRSHSALRLLPLRVSFRHYLSFLRGTSSYHHYFPLPSSITRPPFMSLPNPVSLCV